MALPENTDKQAYLDRMKSASIEKTAAAASLTPQSRYSSPFLNLSDMSIPDKMSEIFQWCKYFFMFDPLIHGAINALATFPVTPITLEDSMYWVDKRKAASKEEEEIFQKDSDLLTSVKYQLFQKVKIYKLLIEIGIDYFLYGNCFILGEIKKNEVTDEAEWAYVRRISPNSITIDRYPDGTVKYKWDIPDSVKKVVKNKAPKDAYDKIPEIFKEAVKSNKSIVIGNNRIYHFSKPSDSLYETPWGMPGISNVLKLLMYRNTLRQAQEAIAKEHIVPLRIFYLNPQNGMAPGAIAGSFGGAAGNIASPNQVLAQEIAKTSTDPNYKVVSSVPIGMVTAGGHGRGLLLTPEIDQIQSEILAGMNTPREFIFGGVSYSGSSVSLKILENHFITYRLLQQDFVDNFLIKELAKARNIWSSEADNYKLVTSSFSELRMQDDVQQKQMAVNLNAAGKVSNEYLRRAFDIDNSKEIAKIQEEAVQSAALERIIMVEQIKNQSYVQKIQMIETLKLTEFERKINAYAQEMGLDTINKTDIEDIIESIDFKFKTKTLETYEIKSNENLEKETVAEKGKYMEIAASIVQEAIRDSAFAEDILTSTEAEISDAKKFHELLSDISIALDEELKTTDNEQAFDNLSAFSETLQNYMVQYEKTLQTLYGEEIMMKAQMEQEQAAMQEEAATAASQPAESAPATAPNAEGMQGGIDMRPMPTQLPPRRKT